MTTYTKDPNEAKSFAFNWADELGSSTIDTSTWLVPSGLTLDSSSNDDTSATAVISGGTNNTSYVVKNQIATSTNETLERVFVLDIVDKETEATFSLTLSVPSNSFQTYSDALNLAKEIPNLNSWKTSTIEQRISAMIDAYDRLTKMGYRIRFNSSQSTIGWWGVEEPDTLVPPVLWRTMSSDSYNLYPSYFRRALCKAQLVQADAVLGSDSLEKISGGDSIQARRDAGILSETIGESSMMFRSGRSLSMSINTRAMEYLTGYIDVRITTTRT